ncbi:MAG: hypothetical protein MJD61_05740, partial [Proteobacteria bacterium]|nr:hypothetical protein [Pseudomonadota bacterium]
GEIDEIRAQLKDRLAPAIFGEIPDTEFGVGTFSDFPLPDYGKAPGDTPFLLRRRMTGDLEAVQAALRTVRLADGKDQPEAHIEALYQLATGEGLERGPDDPSPERWFVEPNVGCPSGGFGMACFRPDALPVVLMFTDAVMHGGPVTGSPYDPARLYGARVHTWAEMLEVVTERSMRVVGLWSGDRQHSVDLVALSRATGALDSAGNPIVFNIGSDGERLGPGVVEAVKEFADAVVFDVGTDMVDPVPEDGVDIVSWVEEVRPIRATPMHGVEAIDLSAGKFIGVVAGTQVEFEIRVRAEGVTRRAEPQRYRLVVVFRGDDRTYLGQGEVDLVVPALDGRGCGPDGTTRQ